MQNNVRRIFVEKKKGFDMEAQALYRDLKENLGISGMKSARILNRYDVEGISNEVYEKSLHTIFSEPPIDIVHEEYMYIGEDSRTIAVEYLPGQYDQRADSAAQCVQILTCGDRPEVRVAKLIILEGGISDTEFEKIKNYCINPVESREASMEKPTSLIADIKMPPAVKTVDGFVRMEDAELSDLMQKMGFAMAPADLKLCQEYFAKTEKRDPTITELRLIDTYWSDHCRHTTFLTNIESVEIEEGPYSDIIKKSYDCYINSRKTVHKSKQKDISLMDLATIAVKEFRLRGMLDDLDVSDEINACSIAIDVDVDGKNEEWLVMFKNETHNHPTEIEPFGGAATCLGGAIRDPLSGRAYVYQAMRVTGCGDPRTKVEDTIPGKLPQRKITTGAAAGYSSYGNQIGLATGQVTEVYDRDFTAKRMEIGAVIGAVPRRNVVRQKPSAGDVIILLGGRTGRDGCGGATGSSKEHTEDSLLTCGAEVQKGNPPTERKIQRLFRNPDVSRMIKKCNDFGAGGVSVAIGELADGLEIDLDAVPKKYEGLDGTELAISESQERMAVVVSKDNETAFIRYAADENLEATRVAVVTSDNRLKMSWRGKTIVDIGRDFLNTNGAEQNTAVRIVPPDPGNSYFKAIPAEIAEYLKDDCNNNRDKDNNCDYGYDHDIKGMWLKNLQSLNVCSQRGLVERFDSSIGAGTVLMPFGGKYQSSPQEGMAAKIPILKGDTSTATIMTFGYNPSIGKWSPFHGAVYAIVEALAKITSIGGDYRKARLSLQEYFEKLGKDPEKWGKPFAALLGAFHTQMALGIPSIGGKDSMSGTFRDMSVPPTVVAFAVDTVNTGNVISTEFKNTGSRVVLLPLRRDGNEMPDFIQLEKNYTRIFELIKGGSVLAAQSVRAGGLAEAITKMCFGNMTGFTFNIEVNPQDLFKADYGSIVLEIPESGDINSLFEGIEYKALGVTTPEHVIVINSIRIDLDIALKKWEEPLERIFPTNVAAAATAMATAMPAPMDIPDYREAGAVAGKNPPVIRINRAKSVAKPRVFIPVFPGTNCEYDTARKFEEAGGLADIFVIKNLTSKDIGESTGIIAEKIDNSQIIAIPGGFSGGDEPDGSGKFIATAFRNPFIKEAVMKLLKQRDGLILGICNGFQALIKLGLVPYGEIRDMKEDSPTLTFNTIGRHVSRMVRVKVVSTLSPWLACLNAGEIYTVPVSHGEGRFVAGENDIDIMKKNGQIATQYIDPDGNPTSDIRFNPNGSILAIEGITSPDGRVFGKMAHNERVTANVARNIPGEKNQDIFKAGIDYFK